MTQYDRRSPSPMPPRRRRRAAPPRRPFTAAAALLLLAAVVLAWRLPGANRRRTPDAPFSGGTVVLPAETLRNGGPPEPTAGDIPDWITVDLLPINPWSRPGDSLSQVNGVVVHYVGNPGTTAEQNRSYFGYLAQTHETSASSHFVVGMDGAVIQCVPLDEIAYCSGQRNADTVSIECCHPDDTGAFTQETLDALEKLLDWLIDSYGLAREDILRHYDVSGKECPRYFCRNPDAWDAFLDGLTFPET